MKLIGIILLFVALPSGNSTPLQTQVGTGIIGGRDALLHEVPYIVSIRLDNVNMDHICGGSIISETRVLSAASCFTGYNFNDYWIVAGEHSLSKDDGTEQYVGLSKIISHEDYNESSKLHDIALLALQKPLILNYGVQIISLSHGYNFEDARISGWGSKGGPNNHLNNSDILQIASFYILASRECDFSYYDPIICGGSYLSFRGGCFGDFGGPVVQDNELIGISAAMVYETCDGYTVITDISRYRDWIDANM